MKPLSSNGRNIVRMCVLSAVIIFVMVLTSQAVGLGGTGFDSEEVLQQFWFYVGPAIGYLVGIIFLFIIEMTITEGDSEYGNSLCFNSPGEPPAVNIQIFRDWKRLTLISLILFSILGTYAAYSHQTFTGIGNIQQQFTLTNSLLYKGALIPAAENLGAAFAFAFALFLIRYYSRKYKWGKGVFIALAVFAALFTFIAYGYINHLLRYQNIELAMVNVLMFWGMGGLITVLTGSFIPFWIMHICNNLFYELSPHFVNELDVIPVVIFVLALVVLYVVLFVRRKGDSRPTT